MSVGKRYLLDANILIEAYQRYYGFDLCPGFWSALVRHHEAKRLHCIDKVRAELVRRNDPLSRWVSETAPKTLFKGTADKDVLDAYRDMINWVQSEPQFTTAAKAEFASVADGWVIAYGKTNGLVVVTPEEYAPDVRKKVPIPNVCLEFDAEYTNTFEMLRDLRVRFVLRRQNSRSG
jgi:hypothetical protein